MYWIIYIYNKICGLYRTTSRAHSRKTMCSAINVSAHVLPAALTISLLSMLLVIFLFSLWNMDAIYHYRYHKERQIKYYIESGVALYCNDSSLLWLLDDKGGYELFRDDQSSYIQLEMGEWGLYEYLTITSIDSNTFVTKLLGKSYENKMRAAFWLNQTNRALSLSGNASLHGKIYAPMSGINYIQIGSNYFNGDVIPDSSLYLSKDVLPAIDSLQLQLVKSLAESFLEDYPPPPEDFRYVSFRNETSHYSVSDQTGFLRLAGKVFLHGEHVNVSNKTQLSDIIIGGKSIVIEDGFCGSMQIFARDTVIIGDNVQLEYPSGICLTGEGRDTFLKIGNNSVINGYAIVLGKTEETLTSFYANYLQPNSAILYGLLYVMGNAIVTGRVVGAAYLADCCYLADGAFYNCTLYDAHIHRSDSLPWPLWFKGGYSRRQIKKVH